MSYEDATATKLLATDCLCCGRPLLDADSVTVGVGPICRVKYGVASASGPNREEANRLIYEAALPDTSADRRLEIARTLSGFGYNKLAVLIVERFARAASFSARSAAAEAGLSTSAKSRRALGEAASASPASPPAIRIEEVSAPLFRGGPAVRALAVFTPYDAAFVQTLKDLVPWKSRGWDGARKAWLVSPDFKWEVLSALSRHFAGQRAVGAKGAFVIPSPDGLPPKGGRRPVSAEALRAERLAEEAPAAAAAATSRASAAGAFPYQVEGAAWLSGREKALLADDMGLGKTWQLLLGAPADAALLAVVPACVKYNWADEVARLRPELKVSILDGRGAWRWPAAGELVIVNYDILPTFLQPAGKGKPAAVPETDRAAARDVLLLVDEAQAVKSPDSARHARVRTLVSLCAGAWFATGTPVENRGRDLWGVLSALGVAKEVFGSFDAFLPLVGAYREPVRVRGGTTKMVVHWPVGGDTVSPEVNRRLRASVMLRRLKAEVAKDLPPKRHSVVRVDGLSADLRAELDAAWAGWDAEKRGELPPFEKFSLLRAKLAKSRIPAALELVEQYEEAERPLLVFSAHRAPVDAIGAREGWAKITGDESPEARRDVVRAFQAGELRGVALTIRAGGVGLTLTRAQDAVFVDREWNPRTNVQAEDRLHRIGQTGESVHYTDLVSDHPLDLHVQALVRAKEEGIAAMVDGAGEAA